MRNLVQKIYNFMILINCKKIMFKNLYQTKIKKLILNI